MRKILDFGQSIIPIREENIKGILIDINPRNVENGRVSIEDFNKIDLKLAYKNSRGGQIVMFNGRLLDYLTARFGQTMILENAKKEYSNGHKIIIPFVGTLAIKGTAEFVVELDVRIAAFAEGLVVENSIIEFETIPSTSPASGMLPVVEVVGIGNGELSLDKTIGNGVQRVIISTDYLDVYANSKEAKIKEISIESNGRTVKTASENLLVAENILMMDNVDYEPQNLVVYQADHQLEILNGAKIKAQFSKAVNADARLLVVKIVQFN